MDGRREREAGQSMVEFSVVVGAFLLIVFAAVSAAFHSVQRAMAETAAAAGIQIAAGASPTDPTQADLAGAIAPTEQLLRPVMFSTDIQRMPGRPCADLSSIPNQTLQVCTYRSGPALVAETVRGHPAYVVPFLARRLGWSIDVTLEMHQVVYQQ